MKDQEDDVGADEWLIALPLITMQICHPSRQVMRVEVGDGGGVMIGEHCTVMDNHAHQCSVRGHSHILYEWPDCSMEIMPFLDSLGCVEEAPIVMAVIDYDDPTMGHVILLIIHQVIYMKGMDHNLLCPMELCHNGIKVNEHLKHCTPIPSWEDHAIIFMDVSYIIALQLYGVTSYIPTRTPTKDEVEGYQDDGDYLELMADTPEWDLHSKVLKELKSHLVNRFGRLLECLQINPRQVLKLQTDRDYDDPFQRSVYMMTTSPHPGKWKSELLA